MDATPWGILLVTAGSGVLSRTLALALRPAGHIVDGPTHDHPRPLRYRAKCWWIRPVSRQASGTSQRRWRRSGPRPGFAAEQISRKVAHLRLTRVVSPGTGNDVSFDPVTNTARGLRLFRDGWRICGSCLRAQPWRPRCRLSRRRGAAGAPDREVWGGMSVFGRLRPLLDTALDRAVVPGYTRIGYQLRRSSWAGDPPPGALRAARRWSPAPTGAWARPSPRAGRAGRDRPADRSRPQQWRTSS
ncbi:hypothetical protein BZL30_0903 [Mycobacterium kansasii]|uniref:Uncharacterized protein n=1 Tax=Mycobacterium kansasii TaxID=1768 RepID=A0A1V3XT73_MYCKA|nr:hypothetical protein BZL30_0903 [Mycobacterium kansasii]